MSQLDFNIGAKIQCKDGDCGNLKKVVFDPYTKEITNLIIEEGFLFKTDRVLPVSLIEQVTPDAVYLAIKRNRYEGFPQYREFEYETVQKPGKRDSDVVGNHLIMRINPYGISTTRPFIPAVRRKRVHENVAEEQQVLDKGTTVVDREENKLGTLDHVLLDQNTCKLNQIIMNRGSTKESKVIPATVVDSITGENIILSIGENQVEELPSYIPRENGAIFQEIQDYLKQQTKLENLTVFVDKGVLTLSGHVKDVLLKRRIEAAVRSIRGLIDVKNELWADSAIEHSVSTILAHNSITEVSIIHVKSEEGVVTLSGKVDNQEIVDVAESLSSMQPGVKHIRNNLRVEHDELTPFLLNRLGWSKEKEV